jgi:nucleoside 2-deoxyribosyltransferase
MDTDPSDPEHIKINKFKETDLIELYSKRLISRKANLDILILGSYKPHNSIADLEKLKDILIEKGMKKAHLAIDFMQQRTQELTEAEYNYVNSFNQIKSCDFELFVLYGNRDNSGPATELQFSLQSNFGSKVYVGIRSSDVSQVSSMIRGAIDHHKIVKYEFESLEDLASAFEGYLDNKELI